MAKNNSLKLVKKGLQLVIYAAVGYFIGSEIIENWGSINWAEVNWLLLIPAILVYALHGLWNGLNWHFLVKSSGEKVSKSGQIDVYLRSYVLRYIPGNVVGIASRAIFNKKYQVPMLKSLWGWFVENITYLLVGAVIGSFVVLFFSVSKYLAAGVIFSGIIGSSLVIWKMELLEKFWQKYVVPRIPQVAKAESEPLGLSYRDREKLLLRYVVSWAIYSLSYILLVTSVVPLELTDYLFVISINAAAWTIGYMSLVTPSGGGVREVVMAELLGKMQLITEANAIIITFLARVVFILGELSSFGIFYAYQTYRLFKNRKNAAKVS